MVKNKDGNSPSATFKLPHGPKEENYEIHLYVQITDDSDGYFEYHISTPVIVLPNDELIQKFTAAFLEDNSNSTSNSSTKNEFLEELRNSDVSTVTTFIMSYTTIINSQFSLGTSNSSNSSNSVNLK